MVEPAGHDEAVNRIEIRTASAADLAAAAELRRQMESERRRVDPHDGFVAAFVAWAAEQAPTHRCLVAVSGEAVIGMAWLAVTPRVPTPRSHRRAAGDLQSVYVVPEHRGRGVGSRLIEAVLALAGELGLERVTVHSSSRAITAYERAGFAVSHRLLQTEVGSSG